MQLLSATGPIAHLLFLCDQVADIRPRQTSSVVVTLTGNSLENTHGYNRKHMVSVLHDQEALLQVI